MKAHKRLDRCISELRAWRADSSTDSRRKQALTEFKKYVNSDAPRAAVVAAGYLQAFSSWVGSQGVLDVLDGDESGWEGISKAYHYLWWKVRISEPHLTMASDVALVMAHAVAVGDEKRVAWLYESLRASYLKSGPEFLATEFSSLGLCLLNLWEMEKKAESLTRTKLKAKPATTYAAIVAALQSDPSGLEKALLEACDYHLVQGSIQSGYPEFAPYPYKILPIEIQAIGSMCSHWGQSMPEIEHPLMSTPLAELPRVPDRYELECDPVAGIVVDKARQGGFID